MAANESQAMNVPQPVCFILKAASSDGEVLVYVTDSPPPVRRLRAYRVGDGR